MSVIFCIGPFDPSLWQNGKPSPEPTSSLAIEPVEYQRKLLERWPHAREWSGGNFAGSWTLDEYNLHGIEVELHNDLQHVTFKSKGINFLDFILWHRAFVPVRYQLYLFNSSGWDSLILLSETTRAQVIQFTGHLEDTLIKDSPLNGAWDGLLAPVWSEHFPEYRCVLHLFAYVDHLHGEMLIAGNRSSPRSIYAYLRGDPVEDNGKVRLDRLERTDSYGGGVPPSVQAFRSLRLEHRAGSPPTLEGTLVSREHVPEETVGILQLKRRGLYDPPPS